MRLRGVGVCVGSRWQTATASPRPPKARRRGHRQGSPPALGPTQSRQGIEVPRQRPNPHSRTFVLGLARMSGLLFKGHGGRGGMQSDKQVLLGLVQRAEIFFKTAVSGLSISAD
jgi:hypothetical protein